MIPTIAIMYALLALAVIAAFLYLIGDRDE